MPGRIMPKRMQELNLEKELKSLGIAIDTKDLSALIDSTLSYPENARNIMKQHKNVSNSATKSKQNRFGVSNEDFSNAAKSHAARSSQARQTDEATRAKRTYTERQVSRKPSILDQWFKQPGKIDIFGIDAFGSSKARSKPRR